MIDTDCKLLQRLLDGISGDGVKKGYSGHVHIISNAINNLAGKPSDPLTLFFGPSSGDDKVRALLSCFVLRKLTTRLQKLIVEQWREYVNGPLDEVNRRNNTLLVCVTRV